MCLFLSLLVFCCPNLPHVYNLLVASRCDTLEFTGVGDDFCLLEIHSIMEKTENTGNEFLKTTFRITSTKMKRSDLRDEIKYERVLYPDHVGNLTYDRWALDDGGGRRNSINRKMEVVGYIPN